MSSRPAFRPIRLGVLALGLAASVSGPSVAADWLVPSSSHAPGSGGAFFTTDLVVANRDVRDATVVLKFFRHDEDGTFGPEVSYVVPARQVLTVDDVLANAFGFASDWGAIRVTADTSLLAVTSETSTKAARGGTYGQSVPGFTSSMLLTGGAPGTIAGIRHDGAFRTNLVLANAINDQIVVHGELFDAAGGRVGSGRDWVLPPYGMTQSTSVVEEVGGSGATVVGGRVVLSSTGDAAFAAYAAVIDRGTNDPRTLLPTARPEPALTWILPSSAHAPGAGGAFYTTDLTLANTGTADATVALRFLGHDEDGTLGPRRVLDVAAGATVRVTDVLGSLFGVPSGYGALLVTSSSPSIAVGSETSTPAPGGGTFGQCVSGVPDGALVRTGATATIAGVREDASFRTNLVLANPTSLPVTVHVALWSSSGASVGTRDVALPPASMTQLNRVAAAIGGPGTSLSQGVIDLSTATPGGAFAAYASLIDNATNDPRVLVP